jgi:hypothetical protein
MAKIIDFVSEQGLKPASLLKMAFPNVLKTVNPTEPKRNDVVAYEPFTQFEISSTVLLTFIVIFLVLILCSLFWCNKNTVSLNSLLFSNSYILILSIFSSPEHYHAVVYEENKKRCGKSTHFQHEHKSKHSTI